MTGLIPTGLKLYFGIAFAAVTLAVIGGWTSGGSVIGPISAGYKGGIGDHVSYSVLAGVAFVSLIVGGMLTYFRDVDAEEVARARVPQSLPLVSDPSQDRFGRQLPESGSALSWLAWPSAQRLPVSAWSFWQSSGSNGP